MTTFNNDVWDRLSINGKTFLRCIRDNKTEVVLLPDTQEALDAAFDEVFSEGLVSVHMKTREVKITGKGLATVKNRG
jgi:hypothetical protein